MGTQSVKDGNSIRAAVGEDSRPHPLLNILIFLTKTHFQSNLRLISGDFSANQNDTERPTRRSRHRD